jgi:hypothetical protein
MLTRGGKGRRWDGTDRRQADVQRHLPRIIGVPRAVHARIGAAADMDDPHDPALIYRCTMPLEVVVVVLLFAQWPLRDLLGAGAVLANDIAQIVFAVYVAVAIAWASVRGAHLTAHPDALARTRWRRVCATLLPLPWCIWVLATALAPTWNSVRQLERFPESFTPGYFLIKLAAIVLPTLLAWQCVRELRASWR